MMASDKDLQMEIKQHRAARAEVDALRAELATVTRELAQANNRIAAFIVANGNLAVQEQALATVIAERDALYGQVDNYSDDLKRVCAERDALRAKVDAVPWDALSYALPLLENDAIVRPDLYMAHYKAVEAWYDANEPVSTPD